MNARLQNIETIIVVLMENRSFDHMLGYLSLPPSNRTDINGLNDNTPYSNEYNGKTYPSFPLKGTRVLEDPPHERETTRIQFGTPAHEGAPFPMDGFVKSYATRKTLPANLAWVMGYHTGDEVPTYDFFAKQFAVCDNWFTPIPCGTQPNRLMAMGGESRIGDNTNRILPNQDLVYDWLNKNKIEWCTYNHGLFPFFALMPRWQDNMLTDLVLPFKLVGKRRFKKYKNFAKDWAGKTPIPKVIFIEPEYSDILDDSPNDDHPPTDILHGQAFIRDIYQTLISNPSRWEKTMLILTYDEPGGCFDHAQPLKIRTEAPKGEDYEPFTHTGGRVPALVVSPYIEAGTAYHEPLDHTSILQLLADRFTPGKGYSEAVTQRHQVLGKLSGILNRDTPRQERPQAPSVTPPRKIPVAPEQLTANANATCDAFQCARVTLKEKRPILWHLFQLFHRSL